MADIKCRLVRNIPAASPGDTIAIVTLPEVPKENAVLKVHSGETIAFFRVRALAYETADDQVGPQGQPPIRPAYLLVVTTVDRNALLEPFPG
jgi:hypothetical protein